MNLLEQFEMKTILIPTDFSKSATNAAMYGLYMAQELNANIILCHAFMVFGETPMATQLAWPAYDYETMKKEADASLGSLSKLLNTKAEAFDKLNSFRPAIKCHAARGTLVDVASSLMTENKICLIVMGGSEKGEITQFFMGSSTREMIEYANCPVLIVPPKFVFKKIRRMTFATDLHQSDINILHVLSTMALRFNADLTVSHIFSGKKIQQDEAEMIFLNEVTNKINYDKIYYHALKDPNITNGLEWISEQGKFDMMVMVHRKRGFLQRWFAPSRTKKQIGRLVIPLMVFPSRSKTIFY
jgi:nucleotide-binding universal stress UspA family protein